MYNVEIVSIVVNMQLLMFGLGTYFRHHLLIGRMLYDALLLLIRMLLVAVVLILLGYYCCYYWRVWYLILSSMGTIFFIEGWWFDIVYIKMIYTW